jgi:glycosyltransferase involved in cell wall biosynthesis
MRSALACVANSPGLKKLSELHDSIKVRVIPNGVDTDYFKPSQRKSGSIFKFLFVGRFQGQKNLFWLLDRIEAVTLESSRKFEVHLVGAGPAEMHLRKRAVDRNIGDVVVWHTWCDRANLLIYYQNANCLLNPSLYEGMPNTVLEAMACGLPVIASNVMGNDLCITQGVDGFLFDLHDDRKFAQLMGFFLEKPLEAERLGSNARKKAVEMFTWDSTASQYRRLFSKSAPDIGMLPAPV